LLLPNVLWAPVNVILTLALRGGFSPVALAGTRWTSFAILLGLALAFPPYRRLMAAVWPTRADTLRLIAYGFCFFGPAHAIYYFALSKTSSFEGTILGTTSPLWVTALAFLFLRELPNRLRMAGIAVGTVGAYIVSVGWNSPRLDVGHSLGNLMYLCAVLLECIAGILSIGIARRSSGITALWYQVAGAAVFLCLAPIFAPSVFPVKFPPLTAPSAVAFGCLAYLILVAGFINFGIWYRLAERVPISLLALTLLLQPPIAAVFGVLVLHEKFSLQVVAGTSLILLGLVIGTLKGKLKNSAESSANE